MADYTFNQAWNTPECGSVIIIYHDSSVINTPFWPGDIGQRNEYGCDSRSLICSPWPNVDKLDLLKEKIEHTLHHHKSRCHKIFVTQGILTPGMDTIRAGLLPGKTSSISRLSVSVNKRMVEWIEHFAAAHTLNVVMVDFYEICDVVSIILQRIRVNKYNSSTDPIPLSEVASTSAHPAHCHEHEEHAHNKEPLDNHTLDGNSTPLLDVITTPPNNSTSPPIEDVALPLPELTTPTPTSAAMPPSTPYPTSSPTPMYDGAGPETVNSVGVC